MKVVFVSNYINHHQIPVSEELLRLCESEQGEYTFIQTQPMEEERVKMGWGETLSVPGFVKNFWEEEEKCAALIMDADVVIFGGVDEESYIQDRLQSGKPVWRYSERIYKTGRWKFITPRGLRKKYMDHTRYRNKRVYMLCSGAYVAGDFNMVLAYPKKKYKYGYFPRFREMDLNKLWEKKRQNSEKVRILWAARMIDWKHPETALYLARDLKKAGYQFTLTMLGDGEKMPYVKQLIQEYDIGDCVELKGFCNPEETREYMEKSHIYLATSDRQEGWGAVINESMNSAMAVVANKAMGAAKTMMEDGKNGVLYKGSCPKDLWKRVAPLMEEKNRTAMGSAAYETVASLWNHKVAAQRLYECMKEEWLGKKIPTYDMGPLSPDR